MTNLRSVLVALFAFVLLAPAAQAQAPGVAATPAPEAAATRPGPTVEAAAVGVRRAPAANQLVAGEAMAQQGQFGRAETYMIVGGAAFVAGLLIGDDAGTIVMVGGAVIGLYGLYLYLQSQ